jgi:hypothetical protein
VSRDSQNFGKYDKLQRRTIHGAGNLPRKKKLCNHYFEI